MYKLSNDCCRQHQYAIQTILTEVCHTTVMRVTLKTATWIFLFHDNHKNNVNYGKRLSQCQAIYSRELHVHMCTPSQGPGLNVNILSTAHFSQHEISTLI